MDPVNPGQPVAPSGSLMVAPQIWKHERGPHVLHHHHANGWVGGTRRRLLDAGRRSSHDLSPPVGVFCTQYYIDLHVLCDFAVLFPESSTARGKSSQRFLRLHHDGDHVRTHN